MGCEQLAIVQVSIIQSKVAGMWMFVWTLFGKLPADYRISSGRFKDKGKPWNAIQA